VTKNYDWIGADSSDGLWGFPDIKLGKNTEAFEQRFFLSTNDSNRDATHPLSDSLAQECNNTEEDIAAQRLNACQSSRLRGNSTIKLLPDDLLWDGKRAFGLGGEVQYLRNQQPDLSDLPFLADLLLFIGKENLKDKDGTFYSQDQGATGADYISSVISGSQVRLGRLRIENRHGSELQPLSLPWVIESWQGSLGAASFQKELMDGCSAKQDGIPDDLGEPGLEQGLGLLQMPINKKLIDSQSGTVNLVAPETPGRVLVEFPQLKEWLYYDWNGDGVREFPTGLATFGIYQGPKPLIFRRELYRGM